MIAEQEVQNVMQYEVHFIIFSQIAGPNGFCPSIIEFLLRCVSLKPRSTAALTFEFWIALQDIPLQQKHEACRSVFSTLLDHLFNQLAFPDEFDGAKWVHEYSDSEEDLIAFRSRGQVSIQSSI